MSRKPPDKKESIQVKQTDEGLHLTDSILWFDAQKQGGLSFLSSAATVLKSFENQVIATAETVKILEALRRRPTALICQYNRPFSIGRLKMELLPSGCILGGALLHVETDQGQLLYAPQVQSSKISTVRQMQLKKAGTLILGPTQPDPSLILPSRKREKERLLERVIKMFEAGETPVVLCDPLAMAQELTQLFCTAGLPLAVHDSIYRINTVYEAYGSKLGDYKRHSKYTRQKVVLMPLSKGAVPVRQTVLSEGPLLVVEGGQEDARSPMLANKPVVDRFTLRSYCDGQELRDIISAVAPKELYIFGPYAKRYVAEWAGLCPSIKPVFPNDQPTLF